MCDDALRYYPYFLEYVPDWFVTQGQLKLWHDNNYAYNDEGLSEWYEGYQKRKAQKASIKDKLMPTALDPLRYWEWCMSEEEKKKGRGIVGINISFFVSDDRIQKFFGLKEL